MDCPEITVLALVSSASHQTYCAQLLSLRDGDIDLLGEVLVRLEYLSARHGGGVVESELRWLVDLFEAS